MARTAHLEEQVAIAALDRHVISRLITCTQHRLIGTACHNLGRHCQRVVCTDRLIAVTMGRREVRLSVMSNEHMVTGRKLRILGYMSRGDRVPTTAHGSASSKQHYSAEPACCGQANTCPSYGKPLI